MTMQQNECMWLGNEAVAAGAYHQNFFLSSWQCWRQLLQAPCLLLSVC